MGPVGGATSGTKTGVVMRGVPMSTVGAIAVICLGIGFGAAWQLKPAPQVKTVIGAQQQPGPDPHPAATAPATAPAVAAAPTAQPSSSAGLPPLAPADGQDGSELLSYQGYLIVRSSIAAEVFVQGTNIGATNEKLVARCQQRNVRLRDPRSARWATRGESVEIACKQTTTVVIQPDP